MCGHGHATTVAGASSPWVQSRYLCDIRLVKPSKNYLNRAFNAIWGLSSGPTHPTGAFSEKGCIVYEDCGKISTQNWLCFERGPADSGVFSGGSRHRLALILLQQPRGRQWHKVG